MEETEQQRKTRLASLLKDKLNMNRFHRQTKKTKQNVMDKSLEKLGIDKDKLSKDLEEVKKQGGLEFTVKN
jgi:hypothetical protein